MILTETILKLGRSYRGGWTREQMRLIGLEWPLVRGWKPEVIGQEFPDDNLIQFVYLKNRHLLKKHSKALVFTRKEAMERLCSEKEEMDPQDEWFYMTQGL